MITLEILFSQTKNEATFEILALLFGAATIGYVTAWFYSKSISKKNIQKLEYEIEELKKHIEDVFFEKSDLQKSIITKDNKISHLFLEVNALKALHAEAVHETIDMTLKNTHNEQLLHEKDEVLKLISQRKHLLDYENFGTATIDEKDDLKFIIGIGPFIEERLHALDIYTFRQISKFSKNDIKTVTIAIEHFEGRIERDEWVKQAKKLTQ